MTGEATTDGDEALNVVLDHFVKTGQLEGPHRSPRCPNKWACKVRCACHRLEPDELVADLASHYDVVSYYYKEPLNEM